MMLVPRRNYDLFDDIFDDPFFRGNENKLMKTDIRENESSYELIIDLPGFDKNNIKMTISDGYLTINAKNVNNHDEKDKHGKYVRRERYFGECSRSFYVGKNVTEEEVKASYKDGVLKVELPKDDPNKKVPEKKYIQIEG